MAQSVRDGYRPVELLRLERALGELYFLASPGRSSWSEGRIRTSNDQQPLGDSADPATHAARLELRHFLERVERLAEDVTGAVRRDPADPILDEVKRWERRRAWCSHCRKGMRKGARYCDRCGRPLGE